jgi:hypothetical protein
MIKLKRFNDVVETQKLNEELDPITISALTAAIAGTGITIGVITDVVKFMKEKGYTGIDGFFKALKEWRSSKEGDDVASKF